MKNNFKAVENLPSCNENPDIESSSLPTPVFYPSKTSKNTSQFLTYLNSPHLLLGVWIAVLFLFSFFRTAIQVDEARYLTVAWEMGAKGDYWVPHLNGTPYSHKGPLLFWITNLLWSVAGPSLGVARCIPIIFVGLTTAVLFPLTKRLFPGESSLPLVTQKIFMSHFIVLTISLLYMFDTLMMFWVTSGFLCLYTPSFSLKRAAGLGFLMGCAILTKGPVIFVYLIPVMILRILLFPLQDKKFLILKYGISILLGICIGLVWALPAAFKGGEAYAQTLLWTQTARRLVNSPYHYRPWWFYFLIFPLFLVPFCFLVRKEWFQNAYFQSLWRNLHGRLLIIWIGTVFILFSLMSCKQPQYLLPLLPFICILLAKLYTEISRSQKNLTRLGIISLLFWFALLPFLNNLIEKRLPLITLSHHINKPENQSRPLAYMNTLYHGELGFLTKRSKVDVLYNIHRLKAWFAVHPDGLVVALIPDQDWGKYNKWYAEEFQHLYEQKGRGKRYVILEKRKMVGPVGIEPTTAPL